MARTGPGFVDTLRACWDRGDAVLPVDPRLPAPAVVALLDTLAPSRVVDAEGSETRRGGGEPVLDGDAIVVSTSGTSGPPKGVVHTHDSVRASALAASSALAVDPVTDRWLCCLPVAHIGGLSVITRALALDVDLEVHDRFDAEAVVEAARRGATLTSVVPTALARIDPAVFRLIVVGGSAPPAVVPPNCRVSYGMTETGSAIVYDGHPLPGVELRVLDGEVQVRGPMVMRAYRDGTDPRTPDGWFGTDDAGAFASDGRLTVFGRRGDLIITGGENVWPSVVEEALDRHPGLAEVAVVGRPDAEWGQTVTAVVVPRRLGSPVTRVAARPGQGRAAGLLRTARPRARRRAPPDGAGQGPPPGPRRTTRLTRPNTPSPSGIVHRSWG